MATLKMPHDGQIVNMLYVDFVEYARVTDVALAAASRISRYR
jgi:prepilin-type processing-associated H-X9-DG protein